MRARNRRFCFPFTSLVLLKSEKRLYANGNLPWKTKVMMPSKDLICFSPAGGHLVKGALSYYRKGEISGYIVHLSVRIQARIGFLVDHLWVVGVLFSSYMIYFTLSNVLL